MDISGMFSGSLEALKRRFGLFLLLSLFPTLLAIALVLILAVLVGGAAATGDGTALAGAAVTAGLVAFAGIIVVALAQLKVYGMMSQGAYEIAQNQRPDFKGLMARTKGFLPRLLPLIAIVIGVIIVLNVLFFGIASAVLSNSRGDSGAIAAFVGLIVLVALAAIPVSFFLWVKFLYVIPATAIEQIGGVDAVKRSWSLTRGSFWRTLGYAILPGLAVAAVSWLVSSVSQMLAVPAMMRMPSGTSQDQMLAYLLGAVPVLMISLVLQLLIQLFTTPFLQTYYTYMFVDQVRRAEQPPQPGYGQSGYPAGPQSGAAFGQPYPRPGGYPQAQQPQPGQPYPQPGQPYPQPGQPYPQPGQPYPPQGPLPGQQQYPSQPQSPQQQYPSQPQSPQQQYPSQQQHPSQRYPGQEQPYPPQAPSPQQGQQYPGEAPGAGQPPQGQSPSQRPPQDTPGSPT